MMAAKQLTVPIYLLVVVTIVQAAFDAGHECHTGQRVAANERSVADIIATNVCRNIRNLLLPQDCRTTITSLVDVQYDRAEDLTTFFNRHCQGRTYSICREAYDTMKVNLCLHFRALNTYCDEYVAVFSNGCVDNYQNILGFNIDYTFWKKFKEEMTFNIFSFQSEIPTNKQRIQAAVNLYKSASSLLKTEDCFKEMITIQSIPNENNSLSEQTKLRLTSAFCDPRITVNNCNVKDYSSISFAVVNDAIARGDDVNVIICMCSAEVGSKDLLQIETVRNIMLNYVKLYSSNAIENLFAPLRTLFKMGFKYEEFIEVANFAQSFHKVIGETENKLKTYQQLTNLALLIERGKDIFPCNGETNGAVNYFKKFVKPFIESVINNRPTSTENGIASTSATLHNP